MRVGNLTIDQIYLGIRIKRSTKTQNPKTFQKYQVCLDDLKNQGNREALQAIKDNKSISLDAVYRWWSSKGTLPPPWDFSSKALTTSFNTWLDETTDITERTKVSYRWNIEKLLSYRGTTKDVVSSLPAILSLCKNGVGDKKVLFNRIRATALSFLNDRLGNTHPVYIQTKAVSQYGKKTITRKRIGNPLSPVEIDNAFKNDPHHPTKQLIYFLCCSGMRPEEYTRHGFDIRPSEGSILIKGRKTASSERVVPLIFNDYSLTNAHFGFTKDTLNLELKKWLPNHSTQDCRRTFFVWMQKAGIEFNHMKYYFGHQQTQTEEYGMAQAERYWVREDAQLLIEYLRKARTTLPALDVRQLSLPKTIDELDPSTASLTTKDIIAHLNRHLADNHPSVYRVLYRVTHLEQVPATNATNGASPSAE